MTETLADVLAQTVATDVVFVDNASGIPGLEDAVRARFPPVQVMMLPQNLGYAGGMNAGARCLPEVDHLALLTHECRLEQRTLQTMAEHLGSRADLGMVGPLLVSKQSGLLDSAGGLIDSRLVVRHRLRHRDPSDAPRVPVPAHWLDGAAFMIRAAAWSAAGGLDESYFLYGEDVDLGLRVRKLGWAVEVVPQAVVAEESSGARPGYWETREHLRRIVIHGTRRQLAWTLLSIGGRSLRSLLAIGKWSVSRDLNRVRNHLGLLRETGRAVRDGMRGGPPPSSP